MALPLGPKCSVQFLCEMLERELFCRVSKKRLRRLEFVLLTRVCLGDSVHSLLN